MQLKIITGVRFKQEVLDPANFKMCEMILNMNLVATYMMCLNAEASDVMTRVESNI